MLDFTRWDINFFTSFVGLRPLRAARSRTSKLPKPINCTFSPLASEFWIDSNTASTAEPASFFS